MNLKNSKFVDVLAVIVVGMSFAYFFIKGLDNGIIAIVAGVVSYYFGSSQGSQKKDETIAGIANTSTK